jgi:hypothetical protein
MVKQDTATVNPTLNSASAILQKDWQQGGAAGNGGWVKLATQIAAGASTTTNFSWAGAANHAHVWGVVAP